MTADLSRYDHFVDSVTSPVSKDLDLFIERLRELQDAIDKGEQPEYEAAEYVELLRRRNRG